MAEHEISPNFRMTTLRRVPKAKAGDIFLHEALDIRCSASPVPRCLAEGDVKQYLVSGPAGNCTWIQLSL